MGELTEEEDENGSRLSKFKEWQNLPRVKMLLTGKRCESTKKPGVESLIAVCHSMRICLELRYPLRELHVV